MFRKPKNAKKYLRTFDQFQSKRVRNKILLCWVGTFVAAGENNITTAQEILIKITEERN